MFTRLNKNQVDELLHEIGPFAPDRYWDVGITVLLRYYRFHSAWQYVYDGASSKCVGELRGEEIPPLPVDCKVSVIYEMAARAPFQVANEVERLVREWFKPDAVMRFIPVNNLADSLLKSRITLIYHAAEERRRHIDDIVTKYDTLKRTDIKFAKVLDKELARNEKEGVLARLEARQLSDFIGGSHLLWAEIANSTNSVEEVYDKLRGEMRRVASRYDVSGLMLFFEVDKQFTTVGEVELLKVMLSELIGKNVYVVVNIRLTNTYIKYVTCRAVIVGDPQYIKGEVYEGFGRYQILLHEEKDKERCQMIVASLDTNKEFCLSRYDWGLFGYNRSGWADDHHYFDAHNTEKLFAALNVKKPDDLLRTIRRRFAAQSPSMADSVFLEFCRGEGIEFQSDYHY